MDRQGAIMCGAEERRIITVRNRQAFPHLILLLLILAAPTRAFASSCGGNGQRACCNGDGEFSNNNGACNDNLVQIPGCTGDCACSGGIITSEQSSGTCVQTTFCGGAGQRACCNGDGELSNNGLACNSGLVQIPGCTGNCYCTGGIVTSETASGTCVQPTACGGKGQRACCAIFIEYASGGTACNAGLIEVPGCAGDCTCGGPTATGQVSSTSCTSIESITEPATSSTPAAQESTVPWQLPQSSLPAGPECPTTGLCGYADLHVHMFAEFAHGGAGVGGQAWNAAGINTALAEDYGSSLNLVDKNGNPEPKVDGSGLPACPDFLLRNSPLGNLCGGQVLFHGDHTAFDSLIGGGSNDGAASNLGAPLFNGWPLWSSTIHQQVYWKWLERAWLGGLRLMVMNAVSNETFCKTNPHRADADCTLPMFWNQAASNYNSIDTQLQAAINFQAWLDTQYGGTGSAPG